MNERKPVELPFVKYPRDPRILDADIADLPDVACQPPSLPLEHQLFETLRNLDLDNDRAQAITEIERAFDKAEIRKLAQILDWFRERLGDESAAWLAIKSLMDSPLRKPTQTEKISRWVETIKRRVKTKDNN
jgi:hypothetical protein